MCQPMESHGTILVFNPGNKLLRSHRWKFKHDIQPFSNDKYFLHMYLYFKETENIQYTQDQRLKIVKYKQLSRDIIVF